MSKPVEFVIEDGKTYAIGSKGDRYEIRLESRDQEAFCECAGFKWINTDVRRDARPHRAMQDCRHLAAARERATTAWVRPRYRLYHPASGSVFADKFQSEEAMEYLLDPAKTVIPVPTIGIQVQKFDEVTNDWKVERTVDVVAEPKAAPRAARKKDPPPEPQEEGPKEKKWYCRSCEAISPASQWLDDKCPACGQLYDYKGRG